MSEKNEEYFYRVFKESIKRGKPLSSVSYVLAGFLINELSFTEARKIPKRKELADRMNVSEKSIRECLIQLEDAGFMIRTNERVQIVYADKEYGQQVLDEFEEYFQEERKQRRFNDKFLLNYFYNMTEEEEKIYRFTEISKTVLKINWKYLGVYQIIDKKNRKEIDRLLTEIMKSDTIFYELFTIISEDILTLKIGNKTYRSLLIESIEECINDMNNFLKVNNFIARGISIS